MITIYNINNLAQKKKKPKINNDHQEWWSPNRPTSPWMKLHPQESKKNEPYCLRVWLWPSLIRPPPPSELFLFPLSTFLFLKGSSKLFIPTTKNEKMKKISWLFLNMSGLFPTKCHCLGNNPRLLINMSFDIRHPFWNFYNTFNFLIFWWSKIILCFFDLKVELIVENQNNKFLKIITMLQKFY